MNARYLNLQVFTMFALLLAACRLTTPRAPIPILSTTYETVSIAGAGQEIDYTKVPPGTVFFTDENGSLNSTRIVPELVQPEWDGQDFPRGFTTTLVAGHWKRFLLEDASARQGYLVDVNPQEPSIEGAEVVAMVSSEYDGEAWVDVLWLYQPKEAPPLPVAIQVYTTENWSVVYQNRLTLEPGRSQGYPIRPASEPLGLVAEISPLGAGRRGDTLPGFVIRPEFSGSWQDTFYLQAFTGQETQQAEVTIYQAPQAFFKAEITPRLQPGRFFMGVLGLSDEQASYVVEINPLSKSENQVESFGVEPIFLDGAWRDVLRMKIPAGSPALEVSVRVYAIGPDSRVENMALIPTITPDRVATELAAYIQMTSTPTKPVILPSITPQPSPTATSLAGCPGALPSRLQVGQTGFVTQDPPLANRVRKEPDREAKVLGQIMPGEKFIVLDGPRCADGWTWWRVRSRGQDLEGWTAEGDTQYWLIPSQLVAEESKEKDAITLLANQVDGANDIEGAITQVTAEGSQPGVVILDGQMGPFVFTDPDRSINIFVSNLTLLGVNEAVVENCADGLFFDNIPNSPPMNILVEGIEFVCDYNGVVASGAYENVTMLNNIFRAGNSGINIGGASRNWLIQRNVIVAAWPAIVVTGASKIVIEDNTLTGETGVILRGCTQTQVLKNVMRASNQGVILAQESWKNVVQGNTIRGVSQAGIMLEAGVIGNQILDNQVTCAVGMSCVNVDAPPEVVKMNTISPVVK